MSLEKKISDLVEAGNELTECYSKKIEDINNSVEEAQEDVKKFIAGSKNHFVNQKKIRSYGRCVQVWKIGEVDINGGNDSLHGEVGYIDLLMLNGRDFGHQASRKLGFTATFRENFSAEHYFLGRLSESYHSGSHFVLTREPNEEKGRYTLYMVQADYSNATLVVMHETTPLSAGLEEMTIIKRWGETDMATMDWQSDILGWIEQNENVQVVYHTYSAPTATMSVGKIRYVEMEQIEQSS